MRPIGRKGNNKTALLSLREREVSNHRLVMLLRTKTDLISL